MMPKAKIELNIQYISAMQLCMFNKYTIELMSNSTLLIVTKFIYQINSNIHMVYIIYTRVEYLNNTVLF